MLVRAFGEYIRARRKGMGLSQKEFGRRCRCGKNDVGLSQRDISMLEHNTLLGMYYNRTRTIERLAVGLSDSIESLQKRLSLKTRKKPTTPLGVLLRERRTNHGLSRQNVATALGISRNRYTCIELGRASGLQFWMVHPLARILHVGESALLPFLCCYQYGPLPESLMRFKPKRKPRSKKNAAPSPVTRHLRNTRKPNGAMSYGAIKIRLLASRAASARGTIQ